MNDDPRATSAYLDAPNADARCTSAPVQPQPARDEPVEAEEAVFYLRVSSKKQMNTGSDYDPEGNSIPTQRRIAQGKADDMGVPVVDEYVEPGNSATSIDKRPVFQQMMADLKQRKYPNVRYVIVYMMSRAFRNAMEELVTKAQLAKMGITLVSAKENFGDGYLGDAMQGIMAIFNELQVRMSGEDIKIKMANKVRNGGTVNRAPIGYLNVTKLVDGREVRTVIIDPERGPLIRLAFELYSTGDYTFEDLADELYDRGLRTRPTITYPAQALTAGRLSQVLRDPYYVGRIVYKGEENKGRHEPLISEELFEQVQEIIETRATAQERRRVHHHYLKGSLFCGGCKASGVTQRMIMQQTVNRYDTVYLYFFCQGRHNGTCDTPHINVAHLEQWVEDHYATIRFSPAFITEARAHLGKSVEEQKASTKLLHQQLTAELETLDAREENLLDLAADDELPKGKIKAKLREIETQRRKVQARLADTATDLADAARLIELALKLMEDPHALYLRCNEHQRRLLNQALFKALYVEEDKITGYELKEPFASLKAIETARQSQGAPAPRSASLRHADGHQGADAPQNGKRALPWTGKGSSWLAPFHALLGGGTALGMGCTELCVVGDTGIEPVTSSV